MFDPRMSNPKDLNDTELHDKLTKVLTRMTVAQTSGNGQLYKQLNTIYWALYQEQQDRIEASKQSKENNFDDLIDIKK